MNNCRRYEALSSAFSLVFFIIRSNADSFISRDGKRILTDDVASFVAEPVLGKN